MAPIQFTPPARNLVAIEPVVMMDLQCQRSFTIVDDTKVCNHAGVETISAYRQNLS